MKRARIGIAGLVVFLGLFVPGAGAAQAVRGELVEEGSGTPIEGALVVLIDGNARQVAGSLTDRNGRFSITPPIPGEYRLRAERIGHASTLSDLFSTGGGDVVRTLVAPVEAISLQSIVATGSRRCELRPSEGVQTQVVWEEARKALNSTAFSQRRGSYNFRLEEFAREHEAGTGRLIRQESRRVLRATPTPYVSASPEALADSGFVQRAGEELVYFAPDAEHLLSDVFLDHHCFRVVIGAGPRLGQVGLAFEPVRARRLPDIRGTLWLDAASSRLLDLEFAYTGIDLPAGSTTRDAGGELSFRRLPDGAWIVEAWKIRMPLVSAPGAGASPAQRRAGSGLLRVRAIREEGGSVVTVVGLDGRPRPADRRATLSGTVLDRETGDPVGGATVFLEGTGYSAETRADGSFSLPDLPAGRYAVSLFHPVAPVAGEGGDAYEISLEPGERRSLRLSLAAVATRSGGTDPCRALPEDAGGVTGTVRWAGGSSVPGATVDLRWARFERDGRGFREQWEIVSVDTDGSGSYFACALPVDRTVRARARLERRASEEASLRLRGGIVTTRDFVLPAGGSR
jgi:hypothetical protein